MPSLFRPVLLANHFLTPIHFHFSVGFFFHIPLSECSTLSSPLQGNQRSEQRLAKVKGDFSLMPYLQAIYGALVSPQFHTGWDRRAVAFAVPPQAFLLQPTNMLAPLKAK